MPVRTIHLTTAASTVEDAVFAFQAAQAAVFNISGSDIVYARADGTDPAVEGDDSCAVPPGSRRIIPIDTTGPTTVKVISAGINKVEVEVTA